MHVLCDDARTLTDDVIPVCLCCILWGAQFGVSRSTAFLKNLRSVCIRTALSLEHNRPPSYSQYWIASWFQFNALNTNMVYYKNYIVSSINVVVLIMKIFHLIIFCL